MASFTDLAPLRRDRDAVSSFCKYSIQACNLDAIIVPANPNPDWLIDYLHTTGNYPVIIGRITHFDH